MQQLPFGQELMFQSLHMGFSFTSAAVLCAAFTRFSVFEPSSLRIAPRYLNWLTVLSSCSLTLIFFSKGLVLFVIIFRLFSIDLHAVSRCFVQAVHQTGKFLFFSSQPVSANSELKVCDGPVTNADCSTNILQLTFRVPSDVYIRWKKQLPVFSPTYIYVRVIHRIFLLLLLARGIPLCTNQKVRHLLC